MIQWPNGRADMATLRDGITRAEANAIHDRQYRPSHCETAFKEIAQRTSPMALGLNPTVYIMLRTHPINVRLPWVLWYLGSVVNV